MKGSPVLGPSKWGQRQLDSERTYKNRNDCQPQQKDNKGDWYLCDELDHSEYILKPVDSVCQLSKTIAIHSLTPPTGVVSVIV